MHVLRGLCRDSAQPTATTSASVTDFAGSICSDREEIDAAAVVSFETYRALRSQMVCL